MPGLTASIALLGFFPLVLLVMAQWRSPRAAIALVFAATLFLPPVARFDLPGLPPLGRASLPYLYLFVAAVIWMPRRLRLAKPGRSLDWLLAVLVLAGIGTALTNRDMLTIGVVAGNVLTPWDALSLAGTVILEFWLPFLLGRTFVRDERDLTHLLVGFVIAGLIYSVLCLYEIRMSPQLHNIVYGGHVAPFSSARRFGGYRPTVFMSHGIAVGTFMACSLMAAVTLARVRRVVPKLATQAWSYLGVILVLVKSTGAIVYGAAFAPLLYFARARSAFVVLALVMATILAYPVLRTSGYFPTEALVSAAELVSTDRAGSLEFRFDNEDMILAHALERPWFGWGTHGRHIVFDEFTGSDLSTVDGWWILIFATRGVFAWLAFFSVMILPVVSVARRLHRIQLERQRWMLLGLATIATMYTLDWLLNGMFSNLPLFLSGALVASSAEMQKRAAADDRPAAPAEDAHAPPPTRDRRVRDLLKGRGALRTH